MRFEWDEDKRASNWLKHRVDFELALTVFSDPLAILQSNQIVHGEERWMTLGHTPRGLLLAVIHTTHNDTDGEEVVRIISARKATVHERRDYTEGRHQND
jgi:uncharacterized protein